jgi:transposase
MAANVYMELRLPYYHPHIQPIELMWVEMKAWVGTINKIYSIKDIEYYGEPILKGTTEGKWAGHCL